MIDQLPTAVPQTAQSVSTSGRDRKQAAADKDDRAATFEDIVSKTGQQQPQQDKNKKAEIDLQPETDGKERLADARPKAALELSGALRSFGVPTQTTVVQTPNQALVQAKVVGKDGSKAVDRAGQTGQQAEAALTKLVEKLKNATHQAERVPQRDQNIADGMEVDAEQPLTASDELGLLLGLAKEVDSGHGKKSAEADKVKKKDEEEASSRDDKSVAKTDISRIEHIAAAMDAKHAVDTPISDDKPAQGDVVRLIGANGRGRAIDIEVTSVPGEAHRDTAKTASAPKFDTATVLEARRYLGFSSEPNATVLATAIKADPTWAEALHAAERSDPSTLGNTVTEVNTLKLQMNPEDLGSMVASLKLKGEELTVELRVDSAEAYQQLSADHDDIVKALQDQGFSIDKVTVQLNATDRTDTGADRDMARQGQPQRDGQAQQRDEQSGRSSRNDGQREQSRWTSSGASSDSAAGDGGAGAGRSGNIYL